MYGERQRSAWRVVAGALCLSPLALGLLAVSSNVDWYQHQPAGWLMLDLASSNRTVSSRAWAELDRRWLAGRLSASQNGRLIDTCLTEQARAKSGPIADELIDHLGRACSAGQMSPAQRETFLKQMLVFTLRVRPRTLVGRPVPVEIADSSRMPRAIYSSRMPIANWWAYLEFKLSVDGRKLPGEANRMSASSGVTTFYHHVQIDTPGQHKVGEVIQVQILNGPFGDRRASTLVRKYDVPWEGVTQALASGPADDLKHVRGAEVDAAIRNTIKPYTLWLSEPGKEMRLDLTLSVAPRPVGVAADVFVRTGGREYKIGTLHVAAGDHTDQGRLREWHAGEERPAPFTSCDVILRSSDEVARESVDLFEIWAGELVYKDVPATKEGTFPNPWMGAPASEPG